MTRLLRVCRAVREVDRCSSAARREAACHQVDKGVSVFPCRKCFPSVLVLFSPSHVFFVFPTPLVVLLYVLRACFFCLRAGSLNRAQAVLVLCRGLFTPGHNKEPSRVHDNVHGCALRHEHGGYPLEEAFAEVCWIGVDNYIV